MQAKTERFEMRLDQEMLGRVDTWRGQQVDLPSRAEAVRRLVDASLGRSDAGAIKLTDGETLILRMICEVYRHQKIRGEIDPDLVEKALLGGHTWALKWEYPGIFHGHEDDPRTVSEVVNFLDMWSFIESGYGNLPKEDKERIKLDAAPFGEHVAFRGFDGNNEDEHVGIAYFLIRSLGRFSIFKKRDLNSHVPVVGSYQRMFAVFETMRPNLAGRELRADEIIELLKAKLHPEHRDS